MDDEIRRSRLARAMRLSAMGARVALGRGLGLLARDETAAHRAVAEALVHELGQLKGLPMKIGQILSYMEGVVPDEHRDVYRELLGKLRTHSPGMGAKVWRRVIEEELGGAPERIFDTFDPDPIASASIGQVHRAVLGGKEVCVKIQYPGIAEATASDLQNLDSIIAVMRRVMPDVDTRQMIEDFRKRLAEECDYEREAAYQRQFATIHAGDADLLVPSPVESACTRRVLTTELVRGITLGELVEHGDASERNRAGLALYRFAFGTLLGHGLFHADPHPGNLLFRANSSSRLAVLDYGCVQTVDDVARRDIAQMLSAALAGEDLAGPVQTALGIDEVDAVTGEALTRITRHMLAPILERQPYRFTSAYATELGRVVVDAKKSLATHYLRRRGRFVVKREGVMFVVRNLFGLASIWGELEAEGDFRDVIQRAVNNMS
jgi:predicted unusual protein kinase regulating ubiquinone biosynthesis (AarF/ABC1/UbiB family)